MQALTLGLTAAICWGIHDLLIRYVSRTIGIVESLLSVLIFGAIVWFGISLIYADFSNVNLNSALLSAAAGVAFSIGCIGHYNAFSKGPIRIVAPIIGCFSVVSFIIAALAGSAISSMQWLAVIALVAGIGLIARQSKSEQDKAEPYDQKTILAWCVMAMLGFSATFAFGQAASTQSDPILSGLITRCITVLIVATIFFTRPRNRLPSFPSARQLSVLATMGVLDATALGSVLTAGIFPRAEYASAASSIFGLVTVLLAWLFLKEKINLVQWAGILVIFTSIAYLAMG